MSRPSDQHKNTSKPFFRFSQIYLSMAALARLSISPGIATALGSDSRVLVCSINDEVRTSEGKNDGSKDGKAEILL